MFQSSQRPGLFLIGGLFAISILPVLLVDVPAMVDYVNHLARMHLLVDANAGHPNPAYDIVWRFYPNLAMDIIVPVLARQVSVETAVRLFLLTSQALVVSGAIALEIAVRGRHEIAGFTALLALYTLPFLWGLLNFQFGCGVAMWAIAGWIHFRERLMQIVVHAGFVALLFASHFFALGIYGLTIICYELSRVLSLRQAARTFAMMALPVIAIYFVLALSGGAVGNPVFDWWLGLKLAWPFLLMNAYNLPLSVILAVIVIALLVFITSNRAIGLTRAAVFVCTGFVLVYLLMPTRLFDSAYGDVRLLTTLMLILPAFLTVQFPSPAVRLGVIATVAGIIVINAVQVASVWLTYRADYAEIISSFKLLRDGSNILVARSDTEVDRKNIPMFYAPTLAAHYAKAFVPSLYTLRGQQPVRKAPSKAAYEITDSMDYLPATISQLVASERSEEVPTHIRGWKSNYDYVYLVGGQAGVNPAGLMVLARGRRFALYAVKP